MPKLLPHSLYDCNQHSLGHVPELNQPTNNLDELYEAAEVVKPEFFQLVDRIAQFTGGQAVIARFCDTTKFSVEG